MHIGEHITWHVELVVPIEHRLAFDALTAEMVAMTRHEPGVLIYERFAGPDDRTVHVLERYCDSAAAEAHLQMFATRFGSRFAALAERKSFRVFGEPSPELKELLAGLGATFATPMDGFSS